VRKIFALGFTSSEPEAKLRKYRAIAQFTRVIDRTKAKSAGEILLDPDSSS
jgi:hypothetical protein